MQNGPEGNFPFRAVASAPRFARAPAIAVVPSGQRGAAAVFDAQREACELAAHSVVYLVRALVGIAARARCIVHAVAVCADLVAVAAFPAIAAIERIAARVDTGAAVPDFTLA